jgi:hypothetical protein
MYNQCSEFLAASAYPPLPNPDFFLTRRRKAKPAAEKFSAAGLGEVV